jgi:16S rRNA (adenine1518-N6/adenine1519-N6)-dimethyltransferase
MSVLIQAFYSARYLFSVPPGVFYPVPAVSSGVIMLIRNGTQKLECDEELFFKVVKACFNKRRKTLRNSVRSAFGQGVPDFSLSHLRPEQLSVNQFIELTNLIAGNIKASE